MKDIIWKSFLVGDLLERKTPPSTNTPAKNLTIHLTKQTENDVALVTRAEKNNGVVGFIDRENYPTCINKITYNDQFGAVLFHNYEFTTIKDHITIIEAINPLLKELMNTNVSINIFIASLLNKIYSKSIFNFSYNPTEFRFPREIIMMPMEETNKEELTVVEENNKKYTFAVNYIEEIVEKANEKVNERTINKYKNEEKIITNERKKYEENYLKEKKNLKWKCFKLNELFDWSSRKDLSLKNYNKINTFEPGYVEVVTGSKDDINDYISYEELPDDYPVYSNCLCLNTNGSIGYCIYYDREIISPTSSVHILLHKNKKLENIMDDFLNVFFAKTITKIFTTGIYNRTAYLIGKDKFDREVILLPCINVSNQEDSIWKDDNGAYTIAKDFITYLLLTGKLKNIEKLINSFEKTKLRGKSI